MPVREEPFVNGEIYHIYNRGFEKRKIFNEDRDYRRALEILWYYRFTGLNIKLSNYLRWEKDRRILFKPELIKTKPYVTVLAYTLMPNHYHLLIKQDEEGGVSKYIGLFQNSYTRYTNLHHQHRGYIFGGRFEAVRIEGEIQLLHTSRYIHLNPSTAMIVNTAAGLTTYPWSSYNAYMRGVDEFGLCNPKMILDMMGGRNKYKSFVESYIDYQRNAAEMKKVWLDSEM